MSLADKFNLLDDGFSAALRLRPLFYPASRRQVRRSGGVEFLCRRRFPAGKSMDVFSAVVEAFLTVTLLFGIYTRYAAIIAFIHLTCAAIAQHKLTRCWTWVIGGIEYCVFWGLCCLAVAIHG
jgi:uncharacterized membrane protein YphA (DoxX/SURF4 family)